MSSDSLREFLETGKDWSRLRTSVPGVYVLKLPVYKRAPSRLAIELSPVNEIGNPLKRRGLVLRTRVELEGFNEVYQFDRLAKLIDLLEGVNPKPGVGRARKDERVIEL